MQQLPVKARDVVIVDVVNVDTVGVVKVDALVYFLHKSIYYNYDITN
jgi:hypothetical protein